MELCSYLNDQNIYSNNGILTIKLKGINNIINMSYIFCGSLSLSNFKDLLISKIL